VTRAFVDYYRCPEQLAELSVTGGSFDLAELFVSGRSPLDALARFNTNGTCLQLPFDPGEITESLRQERYLANSHGHETRTFLQRSLWNAYRFVRPALSVAVRKHFQRFYLRDWTKQSFPAWPIDSTVDDLFERLLALLLKTQVIDRIPFVWFWPAGAPASIMLTHDVEDRRGRDFCSRVMELDEVAGVTSSFQIVPEGRYPVSAGFLDSIRLRGFEVNVHDLNHDGNLFADRELFLRRAESINRYARVFRARGFRSGGMYRNTDWLQELDFSYDMSLPSVAHLEPQRGGCCTVMPFFLGRLLELPLTTTQDYSLFHILNTYSIDLWKRQIALIRAKHGLMSFIVHPDYIVEDRAQTAYRTLLDHLLQLRADDHVWIALPGEIETWWRQRSQMSVVPDGETWRIEGHGKERARLAFASLVGDEVVFTLDKAH
jgi:hypothetical protein